MLLFIAKSCSTLEVLIFDRGFLLGARQSNLVVQVTQLGWVGKNREAQTCTGFIDEVNGLIWQEAVRDVTVSKVCGSHDRAIGDLNLVVGFVTVTKTLQDVDGVRQGRLSNLNGLEATLESSILLKVLAVFIQSGRTNGLEFTTRKQWLEDGGSVDSTFSSTGTHQRVDLVDKGDDVATGADLLGDLLQALFEVTAVTRTSNERTEVESVELLVLESLRNVAGDNRLSEALHNSRLTHTGFTNEDRVVLGTARENLHHALDFLLTTNNRVKLAFAGSLSQVATELVEHLRTTLS